MDQSTHDVRLAQWREIVIQCHNRPEGISARAWLAERDINEKQYYYYQRIIRSEAFEEMKAGCLSAPQKETPDDTSGTVDQLPAVQKQGPVAFAEIPVSEIQNISLSPTQMAAVFRPDAVIRTRLGSVEISNSISDSLLQNILEEMCHA